jgi:MFS family permease
MTTGWCSKLWHFVTVRAFEGFGETFYFPASMSLTSDYHTRTTRSRALAFHQSSVYAGTILGSWLGAWLAEQYGWRVGFYFFGGLGMVLALALYGCLREPQRGEAEFASGGLRRTASPRGHRSPSTKLSAPSSLAAAPLLMLAFVCANSVATVFLVWTPTFLVEKFQFRLSTAELSGTVFIHLASALAVPLAGFLADQLCDDSRGPCLCASHRAAGRSRVCFSCGPYRQCEHTHRFDGRVRIL